MKTLHARFLDVIALRETPPFTKKPERWTSDERKPLVNERSFFVGRQLEMLGADLAAAFLGQFFLFRVFFFSHQRYQV
jgi:hypothetical protein